MDGAVAEEAQDRPLFAHVFELQGHARSQGNVRTDNTVAAVEVALGVEEVHGAAFAAAAARDLAVEFGHHNVGVHADGKCMAVIAIGGDA